MRSSYRLLTGSFQTRPPPSPERKNPSEVVSVAVSDYADSVGRRLPSMILSLVKNSFTGVDFGLRLLAACVPRNKKKTTGEARLRDSFPGEK
jgi:hypothetical protein